MPGRQSVSTFGALRLRLAVLAARVDVLPQRPEGSQDTLGRASSWTPAQCTFAWTWWLLRMRGPLLQAPMVALVLAQQELAFGCPRARTCVGDAHPGYIWAFSTPGENALRYDAYDASRSQHVVRRMLAGQFDGHLVSDFLCCWVQLLLICTRSTRRTPGCRSISPQIEERKTQYVGLAERAH